MIRRSVLLLAICLVASSLLRAQDFKLEKKEVKTGGTTFYYHASPDESDAVVLLFHDWFGVTDLSFEVADRLQAADFDVVIMDLYKGKSGKTNQEARGLMNSVDQANVWNYIDEVFKIAKKKHDKVFLWGFSLGTIGASQTAIKNNKDTDGLIMFYGNVTTDKEQLASMTFPSLMVMGGRDNPAGAIEFFKSVNEASGTARLFLYPGAAHAFAQKLFAGGNAYDEDAKEASFEVAFRFLKEYSEGD